MEKDIKEEKLSGNNEPKLPWPKLIPAAAVIAALVFSGIKAQGSDENAQTVQKTESNIMSASELEKYLSYEETGTDSDKSKKSTAETASKKSTKKTATKKSSGTRTVSESAGNNAGAAGQGSTQTPVANVPANGYKDGTYEGSGTGFGGTIRVRVTVSGGRITAIDILDASGETPSYFAAAQGVISKMIEGNTPNVDAVSGATYSSNGIIQAVQNALSQAAADGSSGQVPPAPAAISTPTPTQTPAKKPKPTTKQDPDSPPKYLDGTYEASAKGYSGDVKVTVVIKNGVIQSVEQENTDTPEFFEKAWEVLKEQIEGTDSVEGIDTVSGATYSSRGILEAVKKALEKAINPEYGKEVTPTPTKKLMPEPTSTPKPTSTPMPTQTPTKKPVPTTEPDPDSPPKYLDGTYEASAKGFSGDVKVTVVIENGIIQSVEQENTDTPEFFEKAWEVLKEQIEGADSVENIDTVSGATYSSSGILEAVKKALEKAINPEYGKEVTPTPTKKPEPKPTATPKPTTIPVPTATPEPTATPVPTATPEPTEEPDNPDVTPDPEEPDVTPEPTQEPEPTPAGMYRDGIYEGSAFGYGGKTRLTITISGGQITEISQTNNDTPNFFEPAWATIYAQIMANQSADGIDTVNGATYSSQGIIGAAQKALSQAKN